MANNNFKKFRDGLAFESTLTANPASGAVGEIYFNAIKKKPFICTNASPIKWEPLHISSGTTDGCPAVWNASLGEWNENPSISISGTQIASVANSSALSLASGAAVLGSNLSGGNISLFAGLGDGSGLQGKAILNSHSVVFDAKHAEDPTTGEAGEVYYNTVAKGLKFHDGSAWRGIGSGGGFVKVTVVNVVDTILPTNDNPVMDGYTLAVGDYVLFTNLSIGNNKIYRMMNLISPTWQEVNAFEGSSTPTNGDFIVATEGTLFLNQIGEFDGLKWSFSEYRRQYSGVDYFEESAVFTAGITNNSNGSLFSISSLGSEYSIVDYSIKRGTAREVGQLFIVQDGVSATVTGSNGYISDTGVSFSAGISGPDLILYYISDDQGVDGVFKFSLKRWADSAGGPGGPPSYTGWSPSAGAAAGPAGSIQISDGTNLIASTNFSYNTADNALVLGGLQLTSLSAPVTLNDDQPVNAMIFSFPATWEFTEIEYSLERGTNRRRGRLLVVNNGTVAEITDDYVELMTANVIFSAVINAGNIEISYISSPDGNNSTFRYHAMRWE